ncbi:hypothetical protein [Streptomyces sp.]|uniref:hypothetical protein n=1 Tax=Streptomyces sp. TaxID=1931 RepID=UPI002811BBD8|nr:hypothetical protein [Streptomyces sp.]
MSPDLTVLACGLLFLLGVEATAISARTTPQPAPGRPERDTSRTPVAHPRPGIRDLAKKKETS